MTYSDYLQNDSDYKTEKPLVDAMYLLQKSPGKGGWTYTIIPQVIRNKKTPFGWVKVKGSIDNYALKHYKLMPTKNGQLFLPVKSEIRKKIKKQAGDYVHIIIYPDDSPLEIPEEIILCFENEPKKVYKTFLSFSEGEQKSYLDWIYSAKTEETKANRILKMMDRLVKNQRLFDKSNQ
ncbi:YdeI/OmpD-associated family protein [Aquimarina algicola]|uniref:DUF1905 domain-containing protein n=1 Tax=Aquimarina algicola TaxID=2589995 RepID=A0A504J9J0_9FLAO|nr:YdeI/OmpD-associated family protein [Aquimarina algicola]TPN85182.1 DUF1905 domain-containing protein [Aquimarina algicola]